MTGLASRQWIVIAQVAQAEPRNPDGSFRLLTRRGNGLRKLTMRIGTINASTLEGKEEEIVEMMGERRLSVLGVCETRLNGKGCKVLHRDYRMLFTGREGERKYGVALILSPEVADRVEKVVHKNDRMMAVVLKLGDRRVGLIQVYAPHQGRPLNEKVEFYEQLQNTYDGINAEVKILMGDFNAHVGREREGIEAVLGAHGMGERNTEGERLLDFAVGNNLAIMNTFHAHRESHKWTWYRWNGEVGSYTEKSMIDLIMVNDKRIVNDVKSIPSVSLDSDHRLLLGKFNLESPERPRRIIRERIAVEKLKEEQVVNTLKEKIRTCKPNNEEVFGGVEEEWKNFKDNIKRCARETLGVKRMGGRKKRTAWWTDDVSLAVKEKTEAFRKWMKRRSPETRLEYVEKRNRAEELKRIAKEQSWERIGEQLRQDMRGTKKLIYNISRKFKKGEAAASHAVKDKDGILQVEPERVQNRWREYYSELYNGRVEVLVEPVQRVDLAEGREEERSITLDEVKNAISGMKNGKSPGCDELPAEIFKAGEDMVLWMFRMIDGFWKEERVPREWGKAIICPVFKKNDKSDCNNYRGVSLLNHTCKIYERILEKRLREMVENKLNEAQHGFRPGRGTTDLIFSLKMLIEKNWEWAKDIYLAFVDLEKAFDTVPRERLWDALSDPYYAIDPKLIRVIKGMYEVSKSAVRTSYGVGDWFDVTAGVRQGGVLSPLLFIIFMDRCIREVGLEEEVGLLMVYADDIAVVTKDRVSLQEALNRWSDVLQLEGMKINKEKTEVMKISRVQDGTVIRVEGVLVKEAEKFSYLGVTVNSNGDMAREIEERIDKFSRGVRQLYPLLRNRHVPRKVKVLVYTTMLRPMLMYGSEAWTLTTRTKSRVEAAEMKVLRLIVGVSRWERRRSSEIREELEVEPILDLVERQQLKWYGHVRRMDGGRYPAIFYDWHPEGGRPVGRPRKRWRDGVSDAILKRGRTIAEVEEEEVYLNRGVWRGLRE